MKDFSQIKLRNVFPLIIAVLVLTSCFFNEKKITYFQKNSAHRDTINVAEPYIVTIHTGDLLSIYVNSLSPQASSYFNPYSANAVSGAAVQSGGNELSQSATPGYLVDETGSIELPLIGNIKVEGLTTRAAKDTIRNRLSVYLKEPTVIVRFLNFKVSVIGEVGRPGTYVIPNERITIPEMLTVAGDLTAYAKQNDIEIIRDVNGKKVFGKVDLTDRNIFISKYFYLHDNDIVYVKANKSKLSQTDVLFKAVPFYVGLFTIAITVINYVK